ncbi:MAG: hypothetical protein ABW123_04740, partial [Cystobacter sp.]
MRSLKPTASSLLSLFLLACGAPPEPDAAPTASRGEALSSATSAGCLFHVSSERKQGPMPPPLHIVVTREDVGGCEGGNGRVELGTTYDGASLSLTASGSGVAVGFTHKSTPSGSAAVSFQLFHLEPRTLEVVRGTSLRAMNPFHAGYIFDGQLVLRGDGTTLEVRGSKSGTIPGEVGGGWNYVAVYPDFFSS